MSLAPITLTTDKSTAVINNVHRKLRQGERGLSITVTVLNEDNTAYNLTGKKLVFCENKQGDKVIVDEGKGENSGTFYRNSDNDTKGIFTYVLQEDVYAAPGIAWFEITDGITVDSTKNFYFDVEKGASVSHINNNDYIGSLKALEIAMAGAQRKITSDLADMEAQITKQIADTKAANEREITQAVKNLTDQTTAALSHVNEYTQKLTTLQSQWDSELQSIKTKATTDTDSAVKAINDRYTNDFAKLKSDFANWQTSTTQNYQKQVDDILARYTNDFAKLQSDFAKWQTSTTQNYQKQVYDILAQVQKNGTDVANVQKQVDDTLTKMQTLTKLFSKVDFTAFVHRDELLQGYVELPVEDSERQQLYNHDGKALSFKKSLVDYDLTLSKQGSAADAYAIGKRINDLDAGLTQLNQSVYKTFDTKENAQDLKNGILANADVNNRQDEQINGLITRTLYIGSDVQKIAAANADINNRQDGQINGLITRTNDIESGVINNTRAIRILSHDGKSLATHANATITARTEYIKTDNTLSDYGAVANAGKVGEAIKQTFLILNASLNQLAADYKSLQSNQVIVDLTNQVLALKDQNDVANHTIQELKKSVEISSAESQKDNLDALHDAGRYYLGDAMGYSDAVLEVATLGNTNKVMQYIFDAGNTQNRTQRRIGTKSGDSYSWSEWNDEY